MGKSEAEYASSTSTAAHSYSASLLSKMRSGSSSTKTITPEKSEVVKKSKRSTPGMKTVGLRKLLSNLFETRQQYTIAVRGERCGGCGNDEPGKRYDNNAHCGYCYPTPMGGSSHAADFGCFSGNCTVTMFDGSVKRIDDLKKRDRIICGDGEGSVAEVVCILSIPVPPGRLSMVCFPGGLEITPTHPILLKNEWVLPHDLQRVQTVACSRVFNLLVDQHHTAVVSGVRCALLGHKRDGNTGHEFWGNWNAVARCLRSADREGFENGVVEVKRNLRNSSGSVWGFECVDGREVIEVK